MFIHTTSFWAREENIDQVYSEISYEKKIKHLEEGEDTNYSKSIDEPEPFEQAC